MGSQEPDEKSDRPTSENVEMSFGDYITSEYSILKTIFSHLSAKHLKICRQVCRDWKERVDKMLSYSVECYHTGENKEWPEFNKFMNPALIFYFDKHFNNRTLTLKSLVEKHYDIKDVPFHKLLAAYPIYTPCSRGHVFPRPAGKTNEKGCVLVFIPQIPGLTIKKYEFDKSRAVLAEEVEPLLTAKGVLLLSQSSSPCVTASNRIIHYLYFTTSKKKEVRPERPCLAGGLLAKCCKFEGRFVSSPVVALTLEGDNVTVHCDIHKTNDHDTFFQRLSENAGRTPVNAERFAFIFNCVGRYDDTGEDEEQLELTKFREYFPSVPYFGFWSYGEFCIPDSHARNMTDPKKIKIDRHICYLNSACASYMIVTVQQ